MRYALVIALVMLGLARLAWVDVASASCKPPKGVVCQPPPANVYQIVRRTLNQNGFGFTWPVARRIVWCESRWQVGAYNESSGAKGLWQLLGHDAKLAEYGGNWRDAKVNTLVAIYLMKFRTNIGQPWWWDWRWGDHCWG